MCLPAELSEDERRFVLSKGVLLHKFDFPGKSEHCAGLGLRVDSSPTVLRLPTLTNNGLRRGFPYARPIQYPLSPQPFLVISWPGVRLGLGELPTTFYEFGFQGVLAVSMCVRRPAVMMRLYMSQPPREQSLLDQTHELVSAFSDPCIFLVVVSFTL